MRNLFLKSLFTREIAGQARNDGRKIFHYLSIAIATLLLVACGSSDNQDYADIVMHVSEDTLVLYDEVPIVEMEMEIETVAEIGIKTHQEEEDDEDNDDDSSDNFSEFVLPPEPQMSEFGTQVVTDFLMQFPTMFPNRLLHARPEAQVNQRVYLAMPEQIGYETDDGRFGVWDDRQRVYIDERTFRIGWQFGELYNVQNGALTFTRVERTPIITTEVPDIFLLPWFGGSDSWDRMGFYDSSFNRIEGEDWMINNQQYATSFVLWDFENNGIPLVEIHYHGNSFRGIQTRSLFRFDGNEFRRISYYWVNVCAPFYHNRVVRHPYFDPDGNLILFVPLVNDILFSDYNKIIFEDDAVFFQPVATLDLDDYSPRSCESIENATWTNHITGETGISTDEFPFLWVDMFEWDDLIGFIPVHEPHYLPGTDIPLVRIYRLYELQEEIRETVYQRFWG